MMIKYPASVLLMALVLLSSLLMFIFMNKDQLIHRDRIALSYVKPYLQEKINLKQYGKLDYNSQCQNNKRETIYFGKYSFHCKLNSIFVQPKPTKEKYISFESIQQLLDIASYKSKIFYIRSLQELPESSVTNPKIVIALNDISEKLTRNFYGIIVTDFYFDITGGQFYGVLYSSYPNNPKERNLSYLRAVVDNIEQQFSTWSYLPYSRSYLPNEITF